LARTQGDFRQSRAFYDEALAIKHKVEPASLNVARTLTAICALEIDQKHYDEARPMCEQALAIEQRQHGPLVYTLNNLAIIAESQRRLDDAERTYNQVIEYQKAHTGDSADTATPLLNLGELRASRGDRRGARQLLEQALAIRLRIHGNDHIEVARVEHALGKVALGEHQYTEALRRFGHALAVVNTVDAPELMRAQIEFGYARAAWLAGRDRKRAIELARKARDVFAAEASKDELASADAWLADHRHKPTGG
jgi:tetratricopeptide (TPR) repeat protein